jgi:hypothetical protein
MNTIQSRCAPAHSAKLRFSRGSHSSPYVSMSKSLSEPCAARLLSARRQAGLRAKGHDEARAQLRGRTCANGCAKTDCARGRRSSRAALLRRCCSSSA